MLTSHSPIDGHLVASLPEHDDDEVGRRLDAARAAQHAHARLPVERRVEPLRRLATELRRRAVPLAHLAAVEMGRPVAQGRAEVEKCAATCELVADRAPAWLAPEVVATEARACWVEPAPLGLVLGLMPWNFPYWQVVRAAVGALAAGNALAFKHDEHTPLCALALADALAAAGLGGLVPWLAIDRTRAARWIADDRVDAVTLTGSTRAGRLVAAAAGAALKPCVLELGGSDPFVVLHDAELGPAIAAAARSRLINGGQSCVAAKRFVVVDGLHDRFVAGLAAALGAARVGDPRDMGTDIGPLARPDLAEALRDQVIRGLGAGARLVSGVPAPDPRGPCWVAPMLLTDVAPGNPVFDEETFGPVAAVVRAADDEAAFALAAATRFALGASVWTAPARALEVAREAATRLRAGTLAINDIVKSDARLPFGGAGWSGWGVELGREGVRALTSPRTVWVA